MWPYNEANTREKWTEVALDRFGVSGFVKFCLNTSAEDDDGEKTTKKTTKIYNKSYTEVAKSNSVFLSFTEPCIIMYFYSKSNKMHQCLNLFYFWKTLYMFRKVFPSIIRRSWLYIQQQAYVNQNCWLLANKQSAGLRTGKSDGFFPNTVMKP